MEEFARATGFPLAFGGLEADGAATITAIAGNRTLSLQGLRVESDRGLGGRALAEARPRMTSDYQRSPLITHHYDREISAEGIVALFALPVVVDGRVRAVLYGGDRGDRSPGRRFAPAAAGIGRELARGIRFEDEVARRVAERAPARPEPAQELAGDALEELRGGHAELRRIAAEVQDEELRARLTAVERRLARIGAPGGPEATSDVRLTPREIDVLAQAALGGTNAEIARELGLAESTVKSYLKTAMGKLEASTRHAAVARARRLRIIP